MKILATVTTAISAAGFTSPLLAHGEHGVTPPAGIIHYLIEPLHVLPVLAALVVSLIAIRAARGKQLPRRISLRRCISLAATRKNLER
jgi:hypothetical protein